MRPLPALHVCRLGVVTGAEACTAGWTPHALEHAADTGVLLRIRRGAHARPLRDGLHDAERADRERARAAVAAALTTPGVFVSHLAAATAAGR